MRGGFGNGALYLKFFIFSPPSSFTMIVKWMERERKQKRKKMDLKPIRLYEV